MIYPPAFIAHHWCTVGKAGVRGKLKGIRRFVNELEKRVPLPPGVSLEQKLRDVPDETKADPEQLLELLASAEFYNFEHDTKEFTVLAAAFWLVCGGPAIVLETSVFGGMHWLHGTHMRSWTFIREFIRHGALKLEMSEEKVYALCLIAFLTCSPYVANGWRRICRQVRAKFQMTRTLPFTRTALPRNKPNSLTRAPSPNRTGAKDAVPLGLPLPTRGVVARRPGGDGGPPPQRVRA